MLPVIRLIPRTDQPGRWPLDCAHPALGSVSCDAKGFPITWVELTQRTRGDTSSCSLMVAQVRQLSVKRTSKKVNTLRFCILEMSRRLYSSRWKQLGMSRPFAPFFPIAVTAGVRRRRSMNDLHMLQCNTAASVAASPGTAAMPVAVTTSMK